MSNVAVDTESEWTLDRRAMGAIAVAGSSLAVIMLDIMGVSVAFPVIEEAFPDTPRSTLAWLSTGYSMTLAALMLLAGRYADQVGRLRVFRVGMVAFALSSLAAAVAPNPSSIIALRFVTGAAGALIMATGLALALPEFPEDRRAMAVGIFGSLGALAVALSPPIAALAIEYLHWRTVFLIAPLLAIPVAILAPRTVHEYVRPEQGGEGTDAIDWLGAVLATVGIGTLILGLLEGSRRGWSDGLVLGALAVSALTLPAFVHRCTVHPAPLLEIDLFRRRSFAVGNIYQAWTQLPLYAWMFSVPIFVVNIWGWPVWAAGLVLGSPMLLSFGSIPAGRAVGRIGHRRILLAGSLCGLASSLWLVARATTEPSIWGVLAPTVVVWGLSTGLAGTMGSSASLHGIGEDQIGQANAAHMTIRRLGQAFGPVLVVLALGDRDAEDLSRFQNLWWILAGLWAFSILAALAYPEDAPSR